MNDRELLALDTKAENVEKCGNVPLEELIRMMNLLDDTHFDEALHRRKQRLNDCGNPACRLDPHTGNHFWFSQQCGLFRLCPSCLERRANQAKDKMQYYIASGHPVKMLSLSQEDAKRLCRRLEKTEYERFPTENSGDILFVMSSTNLGDFEPYAEELSLEDATTLMWSQIVLTPEGRNRSGIMTQPVSRGEEEGIEYIQSPSLVSDAPIKDQAKAMQLARHNTSHLNPRTAEEVEKALSDRMWEAFRILKRMGYSSRMYYGMQKVVMSRVFWCVNVNSIKREKQHEDDGFKQLELPMIC